MNRCGFIGRLLGAVGLAAGAPAAAAQGPLVQSNFAKVLRPELMGLYTKDLSEQALEDIIVGIAQETDARGIVMHPTYIHPDATYMAKYQHSQYGYDMVAEGDRLKIKRI